MSQSLKSDDMTGFLKALQALGLPKHVTKLTLRLEHEKLVEIDCTFHPEDEAGNVQVVNDVFAEEPEAEADGAA